MAAARQPPGPSTTAALTSPRCWPAAHAWAVTPFCCGFSDPSANSLLRRLRPGQAAAGPPPKPAAGSKRRSRCSPAAPLPAPLGSAPLCPSGRGPDPRAAPPAAARASSSSAPPAVVAARPDLPRRGHVRGDAGGAGRCGEGPPGEGRRGSALLLTPVCAGAGGAEPARARPREGAPRRQPVGFPLPAFLTESVCYRALIKPDCFLSSW